MKKPFKRQFYKVFEGLSLDVRERIRTPDTLVRSQRANAVFQAFFAVGVVDSVVA